MNLLQLVMKQMRQRALGTWLTLLSVTLGVALAIAILILYREGRGIFGQTEYGYDLIIGPKGSGTQMVMNAVYHIDKSPGNIPYSVYEQMISPAFRPQVRYAVPIAVGDSYQNHRIVATLPKFFGFDDAGRPLEGYDEKGQLLPGWWSPNSNPDDRPDDAQVAASALEYRPLQKYELAQGRMFSGQKFEAVIGSDVPARTGLKLGDKFQATHGLPDPNAAKDIHPEEWTVVGILKPTKTAADRVLFIPLVSSLAISEHDIALRKIKAVQQGKTISEIHRITRPATPETQPAIDDHDIEDHDLEDHDEHAGEAGHGHAHHGHDHSHDGPKPYTISEDGKVTPILPREAWEISAVMVKTRGSSQLTGVMFAVNNRPDATAVNPADVMRQFFDTFLHGSSMVLLIVVALVSVVAAIGILVSIYNSVTARRKEIAILRALGATRARVLVLICVEAALVGVFGGLLGLILGHGLAALGSMFLKSLIGQGINWVHVGGAELLYLAGVALLAALAGLVPALSAYKTPVATNLVAS